ncbi:branched-chain amino acid transport system substrate-binding protein [Advenella incenata]|jgi:branched-chain amino acid transport system substrate-binding protein|uniref:Branched-chain amino acid transport system substrate-binding protein n=1 Tax=Advenella incenata TaxID=267800 RepID=A0A4Q7V6Y0_9BURK|nr:ABC transporter substrate-binding protein [Advenella incenata]RZT91614.1 branched-chain amino acid transport system substrate-binding protein [Advenella incenata]
MKMRKLAISMAALCGGYASVASGAISDDVVKIGVLTDVSGTYSGNVGPGSILATKIAVEEFGGKVLGKPVEVITADHLNKADVGSAKAREWLDRENVDVITELGNSAVALSVMNLAKIKNKMTIVTGAGASRITGKDCSPTNLMWVYDTYALAKVGTVPLVQDGAKKWYFLTADYSFGHALESDGQRFIKESGGQVIGSTRYPFPGNDFSSFLLTAQQSQADAVAFASAGADLQNEIKQANEFGLTASQKIVAMLMSITDVHGVGLQAAQGMNFAETFYWNMDDETRKFSSRFYKEMKKMPTALQAGQYSAVLNYLRAVEQAKSDDVADVIKALKNMKIHDAFARNASLREDGKLIHDVYLVSVKKPEESKEPWDYYNIEKTVAGADAFNPLSESECPLVKGSK